MKTNSLPIRGIVCQCDHKGYEPNLLCIKCIETLVTANLEVIGVSDVYTDISMHIYQFTFSFNVKWQIRKMGKSSPS